ncbi:DoxX family protein [Mariniblastus fucicola]|uniref:Oxidoreductase CatD n=1 Tax=Mariniblastus fucicola TaxID=980251 RepID=A0A5B9PE52_9BACT|nr:DoxX family protein [Mariniblastus fucicola]QEG22846.1 Putative oxidoreductase CatD [Mariniblastus fucicola]
MKLDNEHLASAGMLLLRIGIGAMMLVHGLAKLNGFNEMSGSFPDPMGVGSQLSLILAIGAEVGCSVLLMVGLGTRLAAIPLAFTMIVALFVVHGSDPWKAKELAAVYLLVYSTLVLTGPGKFSLDHVLLNRKASSSAKDSPEGHAAPTAG